MTADATIRPARDWEEVRRAATGAGRAFDGRRPEAPFFFERTVGAPTLPLENTLLLRVDGRIASQLQVYERRITVGDGRPWAGAVGNVYTLPEYRGEGFGSRLLEHAREFMADKGYAFSILLTGEELEGFYRNAGWRVVPYTRRVIDDPAPVGGDPGRFTAFSTDDLDALAECYRATRGTVEGAVARSRSYWTDWVLDPAMEVLEDPERLRLYREDDTLAGYLAWQVDDGTAACLECGYDGDDTAAFRRACWDFLVARADDGIVWHPPIPESPTGATEGRAEPVRGRMVQVHDGAALSRVAGASLRTTDALVDRLADAPFYWSPVDAF